MIIIIFMAISMKLCKKIGFFLVEYLNYIPKLIIFKSYLLYWLIKKTEIELSARFGRFSILSWKQNGLEPSQAENPSARAMARASSARTHH